MHVILPFLVSSLLLTVAVEGKRQLRARDRAPLVRQTLCPSYPYPTADPGTIIQALSPYLEEIGRNMSALIKSTPGGAVVNVVYRDTIIWSHGDGLINMSDPGRGPPGGGTGFRIGSITKIFTALMTLMFRDSGKLKSLDDNVTNYLPQFQVQNPFQTNRGITFRQLSSHMSGLPRNPPCPGLFDTGCNLTDNQIYENLSKMKLMFPPGTQPEYSNLGFGLLGRVLQEISGAVWEERVSEMVFKPLKMNNSGNYFSEEVVKNLAVGYYPDGTTAKLIDIGWDAPAGQMYSSADDLSQLLKLIFRPEYPYNTDSDQILDGETIREWMQPAYTYPDGTGFGHPWEFIPLYNYTLRTKAGVMNGYNAEMQFMHEIKTGFVFLHSCDGCISHQPIIELAQDAVLSVLDLVRVLQDWDWPHLPPSPSDYTGNYTTGTGEPTSAVVELITQFGLAEVLILIDSEDRVILDWREGDEFQQSLHGESHPCGDLGRGHIGEWVYFSRSTQGNVDSFTIPGLAYGVVYKKIQ